MTHDLRQYRKLPGNMLVSAALVLPLLLLLTFGLLEYGWIYIKVQQLNNAARHGARVGARANSSTADVYAAIDTLLAEDEISGYTATVEPALEDMQPGDILTVTIKVNYAGNADLEHLAAPNFLPVPDELEATVSMAREFN